MAVYGVLEIFKVDIVVANMTIRFFFLSPLSNFIGNLVGVFKITIRLCLSFLSHSNYKLQINLLLFQKTVVVVTFLLALFFQLFCKKV